jgi:membrane dipeptidase
MHTMNTRVDPTQPSHRFPPSVLRGIRPPRLGSLALALLLLAGPVAVAAPAGTMTDAEARALHERVLTLDTHVDIPPDFGSGAYNPAVRPEGLAGRGQQVHFPTMRSGGLDAAFLIVFVGQGPRDEAGNAKALADAMQKFAAIHRVVANHPGEIGFARTADEARAIAASGRKVALIGIENGYVMGRDLRLLDVFHDYGARYFGLVHVGNNDLGDASMVNLGAMRPGAPVEEHGGLSTLGRQVVARLNELGIMVDVSHASDRTTMDAIAASTAPVIASHSGVRAVSAHPRNLTDEAVKAIAAKGGVVQVVAYDTYLRIPVAEKMAAVQALWASLGVKSPQELRALPPEALARYDAEMVRIDAQWPKADVRTLVDHIDYAVKLVGIDHVGIASDFNGGGGIAGWNDAGETFNVTKELLARGYAEADIAKLWSGNLLRVLDAVQAHAATRAATGG